MSETPTPMTGADFDFGAAIEESLAEAEAREAAGGSASPFTRATGGGKIARLFEPHPQSGGPFGGRNNALAAFVGMMRAKSLPIEAAHEFAQVWNVRHCVPPLAEADVQDMVSRAWVQWLEGGIPDATPEGVAGVDGARGGKIAFHLLSEGELDAIPPATWLIEGVLPDKGLTTLFGPSGCGKTFLALDMALAVSAGLDWHGMRAKGGPVVYVAGEGVHGVGQRKDAWKSYHEVESLPSFHTLALPVNLRDGREVAAFIQAVRDSGAKPALIVFDTLARCMPGGEENSAKDMGELTANVESIAREFDCAAIVVHHTGKQGEDERGSSALRGASGAMISVKPMAGGVKVLSCSKMKDAEEFRDLHASTEQRGASLVVSGIEESARQEKAYGSNGKILEALSEYADRDGLTAARIAGLSGVSNATAFRALKLMVGAGTVVKVGTGRYRLPEDA